MPTLWQQLEKKWKERYNMEYMFSIGYDDGKSRQGIKKDIPTLIITQTNSKTMDKVVLKDFRGQEAERIFKELTELTKVM
jgi:hypothetical protein|nr:MAG: hypothetical protein [Bacteriophage sp.]